MLQENAKPFVVPNCSNVLQIVAQTPNVAAHVIGKISFVLMHVRVTQVMNTLFHTKKTI